MTKNAVIYTRVSTEEQTKGYSLETQLERCTEFAETHKYNILGTFTDAHSGEDLERPGLDELTNFISKHKDGVVVVYDADRLSRGGPAHHAIIEMQFEKHSYNIEFVLGDFNEQTPEAMLSKMIKQSIAWYENQQRRERITRGKHARIKHGKVLIGSRPPYGYDYDNGNLVINKEEEMIVKQIYKWTLEGLSSRKITRLLTERKVPTKADKIQSMRKHNKFAQWGKTSVTKILKNETYTGVWYYGKRKWVKVDGKKRQVYRPRDEWMSVEVPTIIDKDIFEQAQKIMSSNKVRSKRNTKRNYLLRGMIKCTCGHVCSSYAKDDYHYYKCRNKPTETWKKECSTRFGARAEKLEHLVWERITGLILNPEYIEESVSKRRDNFNQQTESISDKLAATNKAIDDTKRRINILLEQLLEGDFSKELVLEKKAHLDSKLSHLEEESHIYETQLSSFQISETEQETLVRYADYIRAGIDNIDFEGKRRILELFEIEIEAFSQNHVKIGGLIPFPDDLVDIVSFEATSY